MDKETLKRRAMDLGAEVAGVASADRFGQAPAGFHPTDILAGARSVLVYARPIPNHLCTAKVRAPFTLVRHRTLAILDDISMRLTLDIAQAGGQAIPIPGAEPYEFWDEANREGRGILSLKHAAELAGLGRIGKNTLLLNETFGNQLWLGAVVTDLDLAPDPPAREMCLEACTRCLEACPQSALDGTTIAQKKCREVVGSHTPGGDWFYACFKCKTACPLATGKGSRPAPGVAGSSV